MIFFYTANNLQNMQCIQDVSINQNMYVISALMAVIHQNLTKIEIEEIIVTVN